MVSCHGAGAVETREELTFLALTTHHLSQGPMPMLILVAIACALLACAACALLLAVRRQPRSKLCLREGLRHRLAALRTAVSGKTARRAERGPGSSAAAPASAEAQCSSRVRRGRELETEFRARMLALKQQGKAFSGRVVEQPTFAALDMGATKLEPCEEESECHQGVSWSCRSCSCSWSSSCSSVDSAGGPSESGAPARRSRRCNSGHDHASFHLPVAQQTPESC